MLKNVLSYLLKSMIFFSPNSHFLCGGCCRGCSEHPTLTTFVVQYIYNFSFEVVGRILMHFWDDLLVLCICVVCIHSLVLRIMGVIPCRYNVA